MWDMRREIEQLKKDIRMWKDVKKLSIEFENWKKSERKKE